VEVENPDATPPSTGRARREGESVAAAAQRQKPLTTTSFDWNTGIFPDGCNRHEVTASDRGANTSDRALGRTRPAPVLVDNQRPAVDAVSIQHPKASARAETTACRPSPGCPSVDDGPWQLAATGDGLFDDKAEVLHRRARRPVPRIHTWPSAWPTGGQHRLGGDVL
jgi:hypothetical protein